jgi:hypothetical protein
VVEEEAGLTDGQVMRTSLDRLGIRLECERCKAAAVALGLCNVCGRGYVHRVHPGEDACAGAVSDDRAEPTLR